MTVDALIKTLQESKTHMAIVSGEYNDTLGLVTMEDALEEIVGEIYDEHDEGSVKQKLITKKKKNICLMVICLSAICLNKLVLVKLPKVHRSFPLGCLNHKRIYLRLAIR